jgi:hypothetical protein
VRDQYIVWKLRYYDGDKQTGERDWRGFVDGIEMYRVMRGGWFTPDPDAGDACSSEKEGKACCLRHLRHAQRGGSTP